MLETHWGFDSDNDDIDFYIIRHMQELQKKILEEEKNEKLAKFIYKFWDNRKMIKTFPNLKVQDTEGNILYMDSYLDIQPYYLKLK